MNAEVEAEIDRIYGDAPLLHESKFGAVETTPEVRHIATAAYTAWTAYGRLPSLTEIKRYAGGSEADIAEVVKTEAFVKAVQMLGVPWHRTDGLSTEQMLALQLLTNPLDKRDVKAKLKSLGIQYITYRAWLQQPEFSQYMHKVTEDALTQHIPDFNRALIQKGMQGDLNTIKYINELNGRHDPNKQAVADLRNIVNQLLDIIMRNVTDQEVLNRISNEFSLVMGAQTVKGEISAN